ncbi:MAG: GHKL domain-containing protein [Lachnospiraceae bacterium]|nr:GHKL domain-containing protein [Lachnospiraceae bacterium]
MLSVIWEFVVNFLETVLFYQFVNMNLCVNTDISHRRTKQLLFLFLLVAVTCIMNFSNTSTFLTITVTCALNIVFAVMFYQNSMTVRIFWGFLYSVICIVAESVTILIPQIFLDFQTVDIFAGGSLRVPFTLLYLALIVVFLFLFSLSKKDNICLSPLQKAIYYFISITGIMLAHYILFITMEMMDLFQNDSFTFSMVLVNIFFILLFLFLLFFIYQLGASNAKVIQLLERQKTYEVEEMQYQSLIQSTKELREMKHDIEQHLNVIEHLIANGNETELSDYIGSYRKSLDQVHHFVSTGNAAVDCILSIKLEQCIKAGIHNSWSVIMPTELPIDILPFSSLLGNLWDNAIEACQRLKEKNPAMEPSIQFYIKPFQQMVIIHIENDYDGVILRDSKNEILSAKASSGHGIGLIRISEIVNEAEGILNLSTDNHIFTVHIMIPLKETQHENLDHNH